MAKLLDRFGIHIYDSKWQQDIIGLSLVYFGSAWLVLQTPQSQYGSPFWPPVGIGLGMLLSYGANRWLGVFVGSFLVNVYINFSESPLHLTLIVALVNGSSPTIGSVVSCYLLNKLNPKKHPLGSLRSVISFILLSLFTGTIYQSFIGVSMGVVMGLVKPEDLFSSFANWWAGDSIGILVFTPLVISWSRPERKNSLNWLKEREFLIVSLSLLLVAFLSLVNGQSIEYLLIPPLLWSAFRLGDRITYLLLAIVSAMAAVATAFQIGVFFRSAQINKSLVLLQLFIGVIAITTMAVLTIIKENQSANSLLGRQIKLTQKAFDNLNELNKNLEKIVEDRTQEIKQANSQITKLNHQLKSENIRMSSELEVTRQLQAMILPAEEELGHVQDLDVAGIMLPANEVGGDYYDVLNHHGMVKIGIGDVTGHGLESGVIMIMVQTAIRTLMLQGETNKSKFLAVINQIIYENIQRMKSDRNLSLLLLDYIDSTLYVSGQHESVIVARSNGTIEEIDTDCYGFPIGLTDDISEFVSEAKIHLDSGDVVVLYTDGIPEAINHSKEH